MLSQQISNFISKKNLTRGAYGMIILCLFAISSKAFALTLSPVRLELSGDPGTTLTGEFTVTNEQNTSQIIYPSYENFTSNGESGAPVFSDKKIGLDTWISVGPSQLSVGPGQSITVPYTITIPKDANPGGYFAAIFWGTSSPSDTTQVSIGAKIGMLVLLRVNGNILESAGITSFDRNDHGFFYTTLPVELRYTFRNSGGDRVEPHGTITIRDTFFVPSATLDANRVQGNVLPGSTREFTTDWVVYKAPEPVSGFFGTVRYEWQNFALGLYRARLDLAYGSDSHVNRTAWFFVFPWQLLLCLCVGLLAIWQIGRMLITRYNRYIIKKVLDR